MRQLVYMNEGKVVLREAEKEDVSGIVDMYVRSETAEEWWQDEKHLNLHCDLLADTSGQTYIAVLGDKVVGHTDIINSEEPEPHGGYAFLRKLQIDDELRRRKFGTEIVRFTMIIAKNSEQKGYESWPQDERARGLYKNLGLTKENVMHEIALTVKSDFSEEGEYERLSKEDTPYLDLNVAVGRLYPGQYIWKQAFYAAEHGVLDYPQPLTAKIELSTTASVLLLDRDHLYIFLDSEHVDDTETQIEALARSASILCKTESQKRTTFMDQKLWKVCQDSEALKERFDMEKKQDKQHMRIIFEDD